MKSEVITGNNIDTLKKYPDNYFDSVVTDPPYGIEFLNKDWDSNTGAIETWEQVFRVLKPGGYLLAFSAARTYHHLATNIESVGFEIRDQIMWIYSSGFPKAQDIGKAIERREGKRANAKAGDKWRNADGGKGTNTTTCSMCGKTNVQIGIGFNCQNKDCEFTEKLKPADNQWAGWKTALKPAHEPIVMARKPFKGSTVDNVIKHGVGALNIDATRIDVADAELQKFQSEWDRESAGQACLAKLDGTEVDHVARGKSVKEYMPTGRFPSNVMGDISDEYQKFFYCAKVSRAERHIGFETDNIPKNPDGMYDDGFYVEVRSATAGNNHPTVKPVKLMKYLVTLVTPHGGKVLDPFTGSGSTGMAVVELGMEFTGCELDPDYADISRSRIQAWYNKTDVMGEALPPEWFDEAH